MFRNLPQVTKNILLLNIILYVVSLVASKDGTLFGVELGAHYINSPLFQPYQIITHMFMHDLRDPFHIIFNMLLLVMFGAHLERIWGAKRFFIFYISCGLGAFALYNSIGVYQIMQLKEAIVAAGNDIDTVNHYVANGTLNPYFGDSFREELFRLMQSGELVFENVNGGAQDIYDYAGHSYSTMVGASGAIFGLLAGFAMLFPNTQLMLLFPPIPVKAKYLIGGYLLYELASSFYQTNDHIAHLAHVGGAVVGIIFILVWRKRDRKNFW